MKSGSMLHCLLCVFLLLESSGVSDAQIDVPMCNPSDDLPDRIPIVQNGLIENLTDIVKVHQPIKCQTDIELNLGEEQFSSAYLSINEKDELDFAFQLGTFDYTVGSRHFCIWKNYTSYNVKTCHPTTHIYDVEPPSKVVEAPSCLHSEVACISKCCPIGEIVEIGPSGFGCAASKTQLQFNPRFLYENRTNLKALNSSTLNVVVKFHYCKIYDPNYFVIRTNGTLTLRHTGELFNPNGYCLDHFSVEGRVFGMRGSICSKTMRTITTVELLGDTLRAYCLYLSILCLAILLFCHAVTPKLRDFEGICYINYIVAILLSNFFSYFIHKFFNWDSPDVACFVLFIIGYSCMLASTLWLMVMVFHVWETYRLLKTKSIRGSLPLFKYFLFTWGSSTVICLISIAIQLTSEEDPEGINIHKCQFPDSTTWLIMSNGISATVLLVLFAVVIIYAMVLNLVVKFHIRAELTPCEVELRKNARDAINGRLFLLLLATAIWIFELLSAVTNEKIKLVSAVVASLQGFFVSLEFFRSKGKRKLILDALKKNLKRKNPPSSNDRQEGVELHQPHPLHNGNSVQRTISDP